MDILRELPAEDVVFTHIFTWLSVQDLYNLLKVSRFHCHLMTDYFKTCTHYDFSNIKDKPIPPEDIFTTTTRDNHLIQTLSIPNARHWMTDQLLISVIERCPHLRELDVSRCSQLSNKSLKSLSSSCSSLTHISLSGCHWVDKESLLEVVRNNPLLEHLDVSSCWALDDATLMEAVLLCPRLKHVDVSQIYSITDAFLEAVAHNCHAITTLGLKGCWRITNTGVRLVGEYCKHLKTLNVHDCRSVTEASLARLRVRGLQIDVQASSWQELKRLSNTFPYARPLYMQV